MKAKYKKPIAKALKIFLPAIAVILISFFLIFRVRASFQDSGYFNIKTIVIVSGANLDLAKDAYLKNLVGENIFDIDLTRTAYAIIKKYPGILDAQVLRNLPNQLIVKIKMRQPVAQIKLNKYFLIDRQMVILPESLDEPKEGLIAITGLENRIITAGSRLSSKEIATALNFIDSLKVTKELNDYKITEINVRRLADTSILLMPKSNLGQNTLAKNLIQVKIGAEDFDNRLKILARLLAGIKPDLDKIKYIDLRFKEPVVGQD